MVIGRSSAPVSFDRSRDLLFLIEPGFADPVYPEAIFYCWHCALLEGVLSSFPNLAESIDVVRVPWDKPRLAAMSASGLPDPSLPLLILAEDAASDRQAGTGAGRASIADKDAILSALSQRHGFPLPHP